MQLKIISLNLAGFKDWESRSPKIVSFLNETSPDVVLLQEVRFDPAFSAHSQSAFLNKLLRFPFPFTHTTVSKFYQPGVGEAFREGLAILSRFPISHTEALVLTKQEDDKHTRIIQNVDIIVNEQTFGITNVHLSNNKYSVEQLHELLTIISDRKESRIIAGDFNILQHDSINEACSDRYSSSIDFKNYISFPSENITLDYTLIPKDFTYHSLDTYDNLSDHNALLATINIPEQP